MSVLRKFLGQTAIYGLSTVLSRLFNFILTPIYTGVYPTGVYGIFTNMYANASIINAILAFGMESTYFRYLNKHEDRKAQVYNNAFICVAFLACVFLGSGLIFSEKIAGYLASNAADVADYKQYVSFFLWILCIDALCVIPFSRLRADERPIRYSIVKFSNIGCFIGFNLFFIFGIPFILTHQLPGHLWLSAWFREGWIGYVFIANLMASILTFVLLLPEVMKVRFQFSKELFVSMFRYSWPILIANLSFIINEHLDKILLNKLLPSSIADSQVGVYGAVCKIAVFLSIFISAFRLGAEPFFFSYAKEKDAKPTYAFILKYFSIVLAIFFVALVANLEWLKYFIHRNYWAGLPAVPFLLLGYVCLGIYMNLSIWYRLSDQTRFGLYISSFGAVLTIVLNVLLIPYFSYMGAAWASVGVYFIMMVISYLLGQKHYPIPYEWKKISIYLLISVVLSFSSFYLFDRNVYIGNVLCLLFTATIAWLEKDELIRFLKRN